MTCQYLGNGKIPCGAQTIAGSSYCEEHHHMIYQKGTARARRKKDEKVAAAVWDLESEFHAAVEELAEEGYDITDPLWVVKETV